MKINCTTQSLINALNVVTKTTGAKTTMPILDGVLIESSSDGKIKFTTNDLNIGCESVTECKVEEEGKCVVDIKMLNEIIRKLGNDTINIESDDSLFTIKSSSGIFKLAVMNPEEFPKLPVFDIKQSVTLSQKVFKDMISKTLFCVSIDTVRPIYTGALVKVEDNILTIVAIDGFRLALKKYISEKPIENFKAIIPGKTLTELLKILDDSDETKLIKIGVNNNLALFEIDNNTIVSRILEGDFLNYNSIIPEGKQTRVKVNTKNLLDSFERVALFAYSSTAEDKAKKLPVKLDVGMEGLTLSCISQTGDGKEYITAVVEGQELEIGFNPKFLTDALRVIDEPEIYIDFNTSISPVVIRPITGNNYLYIVLPVKLRQED